MEQETIKSYKGFDKDLKCRGFQYEVGKEYETDKAECCKEGFHACEYPLDVFNYYPPADSRFCEVEQSGEIDKDVGGSKVASSKIKVVAEIGIAGLVKAAFSFVKEKCDKKIGGGDCSALNGGDCSALNGGDCSALNGGSYSALNGGSYSALNGGDCSALNGGYRSALNGGDRSALNGGSYSALNGGSYSALNGGDCSALNGGSYSALNGGSYNALNGGDCSALNGGSYSALNGGDCSALNGGYRSALNGGDRSVIYGGEGAKVCGGLHSVLAVQQWEDGEFKRIVFAEVDGKKIKADTFYTLKNGEFVEIAEE